MLFKCVCLVVSLLMCEMSVFDKIIQRFGTRNFEMDEMQQYVWQLSRQPAGNHHIGSNSKSVIFSQNKLENNRNI